MKLAELFNADPLPTLAEYCKTELAKREIGFDDVFLQGAEPTPDNYRNWNISVEGLVVTFDEYQVAPYAAGPQVVTIPFSVLKELINVEGPLKPYLQ
ncbi:MAG: RsiV family protein [Anaerolineales bacterium]|nr:RsiV family protein [Anaerolineales bacterium]